ncbi:unnamed protein product [Triticum turgidum subsp. durum]|uniref:Glutathione S-transferase n=1 Tax=Triticum turgidum subsp. durum TaxID=4567 RepID=A0A9R1QB04_TRITD|nr:unnamed protein product [Triticum turgidum subsp. durum]
MAEATGGGGSSTEEGLTLLGFWTSPFALRARFALNLKGVPYEYVEEDLFGERGKSQLLLASNPAHGGKIVPEAAPLVEYNLMKRARRGLPYLPPHQTR